MRKIYVLLAVLALATGPAFAQQTQSQEPTPEEKVILEKLDKELMTLPAAVPQGAPDSASWPGVTARFTSGQGNLRAGVRAGHPLAVLQVREGLCVDDETTRCYVTVLLDVSARSDPAAGTADNIIRYSMLSHDGKRLTGFAWAHNENGSEVHSYWVLRGQAWHRHAADSPEYKTEEHFMSWLMQALPHLDPKPKQPPDRAPGTRATVTKA